MNEQSGVPPRNISWKKKLAFCSLLAISLLCFLELAVRVYAAVAVGPDAFFYGLRPPMETKTPVSPNHTVTEHSNVVGNYSKYFPNQVRYDHDKLTGETFKVGINSRGFRGPEITEEKPDGTVRVITLGASSTFGYYARDDETYPHYLNALLNDRCNGTPFEVINLGIPHLESDQIRSLFIAEALPLDPDVVTFYEGVNDTSRIVRQSEKPVVERKHRQLRTSLRKVRPLHRTYTALRDHLLALSLVDHLLVKRRKTFTLKQVSDAALQRVSERFMKSVSGIHRRCEELDTVFIAISQQAKSPLLDKDQLKHTTYQEEIDLVWRKFRRQGTATRDEISFLTHGVLMEDLKAWATSANVPVVDAIAALDHNRDVLLSWVHLSPRGNQILAEALSREVLRHTCPESIPTDLPGETSLF